MKLIGELIELISRRAGLDNVGEVGQSLKKTGRRSSDDTPPGRSPGEQARDSLDVIGPDLLDLGRLIIAGMKRTTGEGSPDTGTLFGHGHNGFNKAGATLRSAVPDDRWDGAGSHAYADQNTRQQVRTEAMADADTAVHSVLFREALQINVRRAYLDDRSDFLAKTSYVTFPLQFIPRYGEAAKLAIETAALQAALSPSSYEMYQLHSDVSANAAELREAIGRYSGVEDGADLPGSEVDFTPPQPPGGGSPPGTAPLRGPVTSGDGVGPLAGMVAGAALAGAASQRAQSDDERAEDKHGDDEDDRPHRGDDPPSDNPDDREAHEQAEHPQGATAGHGESGRAPVGAEIDSDSYVPQAPVTVKLNPDTSPGPSAGMSPQDTKLGEGVHVRG